MSRKPRALNMKDKRGWEFGAEMIGDRVDVTVVQRDLTPGQLRKLAKWLERAAKYLEAKP